MQEEAAYVASSPPYIAPAEQPSPLLTDLPVPVTSFVGRESEVAELENLVTDRDVRLLTLLGSGGIGKTRLAIHLAHRRREQGHAVAFVDLQPVQSNALIASAILDALNLPHSDQTDPAAQLYRFCATREMLLVLDNFEHLLDGVDVLSELMRAAPGVKLLVTSRIVLNLQGEWIYGRLRVDRRRHCSERLCGSTPLVLLVLAGIGTVFVESGAPEWGGRALSFVRQHSSTDQVTKDQVQALLEAHGLDEPQPSTPDQRPRENIGSLEAMIVGLLAELSIP